MAGPRQWRAEDLSRAMERGISRDALERQWDRLERPPPAAVLDRPCTAGDGVSCLSEAERAPLLEAHAQLAAEGRATYFVPASGAATRMFKSLLAVRSRRVAHRDELAPGAADDADALRFLEGLPRFAFRGTLAAALRERGLDLEECLANGQVAPILDALLDEGALALSSRPKGLLPFHAYDGATRTAFLEHLNEASSLARAADGTTRLHFTVSAEHRAGFDQELGAHRSALEAARGARFLVDYSVQKPSTDTIALDGNGQPFRDETGELLFRPGGHGSLLSNLADLAQAGADLIFVKNIDNIVHDDWRPPVLHWRRVLAGRLATLVDALHDARRAIEEDPPGALPRASQVLRSELGLRIEGDDLTPAEAARLLDRPARVCGVLRSEGDPGGGPYWVRNPAGLSSPQIVETAQIDQSDASQRDIQARATHVSPADMVLAVRDFRGRPFDLGSHVDPNAVFVADKSSGGRSLRALEHPGLWNGGMADWNTLFVEVPAEIFHPVKVLTDLLERAHQPRLSHSP